MSLVTATNRKWWVLAATSSALAMIFVDQSALPIALPTLQRELGLSSVLLQWILNAYLLALAVLIILGGKLGDKLGHRIIFLVGMIIFISASISCASAPSGMWLIVSRIFQGVGGALMIPASTPLFRAIVAPGEFGKMVGFYVSIASIFLIVGPTVGGFFSTYLSWRWIFWINLPIALIAIFITIFIVPRDIKSEKQEKGFDWLGFISLSIFLACLVFALMEGETLGWGSTLISSCFGISFIALLVFVGVERRHPTPFVDFTLFQNSCISRCLIVITLMQITYMSVIFWAMFLQSALLLSPQKAGVFLVAAQLPVLFSSTVAGRMLDRFGPRLPVTLGAGLIAVSSLWIAIFCWQLDFLWLLPALVLFGVASPMVSIGIMSTIVSLSPTEKRGIASGISGAARQVGGSIGLAVLVALMNYMVDRSMLHWVQKNTGALNHLKVEHLNALLLGTPLSSHLQLTPAEIKMAHVAAIHSYTLGFSCSMFFVAMIAFVAFWIARKLPNYTS